VIIDTIENH